MMSGMGSSCIPIVLLLAVTCCAKTGLMKAMGVLFGDLSSSLSTDATQLGTMLGFYHAGGIITSPIVAAYFNKISRFRLLLVTCLVIGAGGIACASLATSNVHLFIIFTISGSGLSIVLLVCGTALARLSGSNFNLLFSLSTCGNSIGIVLLPVLAEFLVRTYGWRGVLLIIGGLLSNAIPCALAIRVTKRELDLKSREVVEDRLDQIRTQQDRELQTNRDLDVNPTQSDQELQTQQQTDALLSCKAKGTKSEASSDEGALLLSVPDNLDRIRDCQGSELPRKIYDWFQGTYVYKDPVCSLLYVSNSALYFVYNGWHAFVIPHAIEHAMTPRMVLVLVFISSLGNIFIRPIIAILTHRLIDPVTLYLALSIINIISLTCNAFIPYHTIILAMAFCSSTSIAGRAVLAPLAIRHRVPPESFAMAFSMSFALCSFGVLLGGSISGMIADSFSSFDAIFKLLAIMDVFTALFMIPPKMIKKPDSSTLHEEQN